MRTVQPKKGYGGRVQITREILRLIANIIEAGVINMANTTTVTEYLHHACVPCGV